MNTNLIVELLKVLNGNDKLEKLDFTKKEDVEKLENSINQLRNTSIFGTFFEDSLFDTIISKAKEKYNEAHKNDVPEKPSTKVNEKTKANINKLATEYVNTFIIPYVNKNSINEETKNDMIDALYEFGCWVYQK